MFGTSNAANVDRAPDKAPDPEEPSMVTSSITPTSAVSAAAPPSSVTVQASLAGTRIQRASPVRAAWFIGLSLGLAVTAAATSGFVPELLPFVLAIGPAVIAIVLARRDGGGGVRTLFRRVVLRPTDRRWYLALVIPVLGSLAVVPVAMLLDLPTDGLFGNLTVAALFIPIAVLVPAFAEELGWRGYALPHVLASASPLTASIVIGIPWALMHLALYLPGQMYDGLAVWPSVLTVMSLSVLGTWIFVRTGGSLLIVGLFHALFNASTPLTWAVEPTAAWAIRPVVFAVIAVAVIAAGGLSSARQIGERVSATS
jgi:membrane protease YdiL (CAAX protease family)